MFFSNRVTHHRVNRVLLVSYRPDLHQHGRTWPHDAASSWFWLHFLEDPLENGKQNTSCTDHSHHAQTWILLDSIGHLRDDALGFRWEQIVEGHGISCSFRHNAVHDLGHFGHTDLVILLQEQTDVARRYIVASERTQRLSIIWSCRYVQCHFEFVR